MSSVNDETVRVPVTPLWTLVQARTYMRARLAEAGIETPDADARHLMCAALEIDPVKLITSPDALVGPRANQLDKMLTRRLSREPVSRILGWREFYGRRFAISPATLDPRPDSETIVEAAIEAAKSCGLAAPRIMDVGTGSGCLLITLLAELRDATGVGTDIAPDALAVAAVNAAAHGVSQRVTWQLQDCLADLDLDCDLLVTNPPYVRSDDVADLQPEVALFDPMQSLDGGKDGLTFYRRIISVLANSKRVKCAVFEVGYDLDNPVTDMLEIEGKRLGWPSPRLIADLGGVTRCVVQMTRLPC